MTKTKYPIDKMNSVFKNELKQLSYYSWRIIKQRNFKASPELLNSIISESYLVCHELVDNSEEEIKNMHGYVRRVVFFQTIKVLKKKKLLSSKEELNDFNDILKVNEILETLSYDMSDYETSNYLDSIFEGIDSKDKEIIKMTYEGYNSKEISETLGVTPESIRQKRVRLLKKLKKKIEI